MRLLFVCLLLAGRLFSSEATIEKANMQYLRAEKAQGPERAQLFNEALSTYLAEKPQNPSGVFWYNVANLFFYVGDFGKAIAMYRSAQTQMPRDMRVRQNLQLAIENAGVRNAQIERPVVDACGLRWCSPFERQLLLLGMVSMTFVLFSLHTWFPSVGFGWIWKTCLFLTLCVMSLLCWYELCIPPRAVTVQAAAIRVSSAPGSQTTVASVVPGEEVEVLASDPVHSWVRVRTAFGITGYIPGSVLFFIE